MNYFKCSVGGSGKGNTVIVTCADEFAGQTITLAKTGKTYTKTCPSTAPYTVTYYGVEAGTYTVSATVSGQTYSETVIVQDVSCVLAYGFTWTTWVDTASQLDSTDYASLSEVLADEEAVRELFLEHACVDYMADSTSSNADLETIIDNDLCAKWINNSDYALDYLGANVVIKALMDAADKYGYGEWCLMPQVPTMTSNTAPFGTAFASSVYGTSQFAYHAFDGVDNNTNNMWSSGNNDVVGAYIGYTFTSAVKITEFVIHQFTERYATSVKVQGSNDGFVSDVNDLSSAIDISASYADKKRYSFSNNVAYTSYRLYVLANSGAVGANNNVNIQYLQFYSWAPKGNVPVMTANNAPYGEASAQTTFSGYDAYKAFDGDNTTRWASQSGQTSIHYLRYTFTNPIKAKRAFVKMDESTVATYKIQASNTGNSDDWHDISEVITATENGENVELNAQEYYIQYQVLILSHVSGNTSSYGCYTLQFYGRSLSVSVPTMTSNTAPFGEVISKSCYQNNEASYGAWKAFSKEWGTTSQNAYSGGANDSSGAYIGYKSPSKFVLKAVYHKAYGTAERFSSYKIQGSNTGNSGDWHDLSDVITTTASEVKITFLTTNTTEYKYHRIYQTISTGGNVNITEGGLKFYGLDYSEKEFEAGTTKKWLYDHGVELENYSEVGTITVTHEDSDLLMVSNANALGILYTDSAIDLTSHKVIRVKVGNIATDVTRCIIGSKNAKNNSTSSTAEAYLTVGNAPYNEGLDISSVNQNDYPFIAPANQTNANTIAITEWWLE